MLTQNLKQTLGQDYYVNSLNTTNDALIRGYQTALVSLTACNNGAANAFIKIFDKATAPISGTDTPIMVFTVGPSQFISFTGSLPIKLGLGIAITNLVADLDNTAVAAGQVKISLQYLQ